MYNFLYTTKTTLNIKKNKLLMIFLLNNEPSESKMMNFMLFLCDKSGKLPLTLQFDSYSSSMAQFSF